MNTGFTVFQKEITSPFKYFLFTLSKLPSAYFCGVRIVSFTQEQASVRIRQKWFNKNPFQSIYFAALSMAAEMSTGLLAMGNIYKRKPGVSMLVTKMEAVFIKKATGKIIFTCSDGNALTQCVEDAIATGEGKSIVCKSVGRNANNEVVAEFYISWSFKAK